MESLRCWVDYGLSVRYSGYDENEHEMEYSVPVKDFKHMSWLLSEDGIFENRGDIIGEVDVEIAGYADHGEESWWLSIQSLEDSKERTPRVTLQSVHEVTDAQFTQQAQFRAKRVVSELESTIRNLKKEFDIEEGQ